MRIPEYKSTELEIYKLPKKEQREAIEAIHNPRFEPIINFVINKSKVPLKWNVEAIRLKMGYQSYSNYSYAHGELIPLSQNTFWYYRRYLLYCVWGLLQQCTVYSVYEFVGYSDRLNEAAKLSKKIEEYDHKKTIIKKEYELDCKE